ncbi:VIT1/CCC1 transporter family protein [Aspergillus melleus]|uniref:VIT1/CCC1 transporter family protein n=1 Tax=Aspergillus melleus TaxID=138277 RepID=UPI001E8ECE0C|nr:uncharacterized protein LDX57_005703 [Aspergillus melleus]KAH8427997.1 hypothetical protein LDX57_005703 [Aspergillus melleus]
MALLFLKQKLFPSSQSKNTSAKPLLTDSSNTPTVYDDLESQRSYSTFNSSTPHHHADSDDDTVSDSSSTGSTRSRINPRIVSDAILGLSDGLTVPFALSAGLSALGDTKVVVLGGLAELAAGAISMGLGGYVGAKSEAESYETTVRETNALISASPTETSSIVHSIFAAHNIPEAAIAQINTSLHASPTNLRDFLVAFHHRESAPDCNQAWISALTLALGYFVGGFIPLIPYFVVDRVIVALYCSVAVMAVTLLVFGYIKTGVVRGWAGSENILAGLWGGVQMVFVGGVAAGAAIALVRVIGA